MTMTALRITKVKNNALACSVCHRYIRDGRTVYVIDNRPVCDLCGDPDPAARIHGRMDAADVCKRIKAALKARSGKDWSVKRGRGTAGGWITIDAPKARLSCARSHAFDWQTNVCSACNLHRNYGYSLDDPASRAAFENSCADHACTDECYRAYISPADRLELAALLGLENVHPQGVSIMSSTDAYIEYIDRAEGREPRRFGVADWD